MSREPEGQVQLRKLFTFALEHDPLLEPLKSAKAAA
jgi:hypothetical protein